MKLRVIADDLTGALDAAAPFAAPGAPVRMRAGPQPMAAGDRLTLSTESRDRSAKTAAKRAEAAFAAMRAGSGPGTLWFKKVDSVLRGHPLEETLAMARAGGFATCVFAPAFPEMGRITRGGRQLVRQGAGEWKETPQGDLRAAFAALTPAHAPLEMIIPDAETPEALERAIRPWRGRPGVLWAGSRGLAQALAGPVAPLPRPDVGLFVIGTSHPATRAQVAGLAGHAQAAPETGPIAPNAAAPLILDPVPHCASGAATHAALKAALPRLAPSRDGGAILVTGGDCLSILLAHIGAEALDCLGEIGPGLPLSRIVGGRMEGAGVISKSGGFGASDQLRLMLRRQ
ncbi:MAG: four-carbon acid sugar kinase family protein [Pikeienuella sp.]